MEWASFEADFWAEFFPLDLAKTAALSLWDWDQYGQGKCTLDEYIDSFRALVEQARYPDGFQLCLTFWDGLHPTPINRIDNLAEGRPSNKHIESWFKVAQDQWQLMELKRELRRPQPRPPAPFCAVLPTPPAAYPASRAFSSVPPAPTPAPPLPPNPLAPAAPQSAFLPLFNQTAQQRRLEVQYPAQFSGPAHAGRWTVQCLGMC